MSEHTCVDCAWANGDAICNIDCHQHNQWRPLDWVLPTSDEVDKGREAVARAAKEKEETEMTDKELTAMAHEVAFCCDSAHRGCFTCGHGEILDLARYTIEELIKALEETK